MGDTFSALKIKFYLYQSIDRYGYDPGSQATFYGGHKGTVSIWLVCFSKGLSALAICTLFGIAIKQLCDRKACSRSIMDRLSFQCLPSFFGKEKSAKYTFAIGRYSPLIFATQSLIISLQYIKLCISEHFVLPT